MAVTKKIQIQNSSGTGYDSRNIGAEAEYVDVSRDSSGEIITDLDTQTVDSTESLAQTLKDLEDNTEIDSALSTTSTHAVQNKVITGELNKKIPTYTTTPASWDTTPTQNSTKPITSGGVYDALQGVGANDNFIGTVAEWEALTDAQKEQYKTVDFTDDFNGAEIDPVPTQNSANAVASGGVYDANQTLATQINKAYKSDDSAETTIDDADYIPFYDSSASAMKKILVSNAKFGGGALYYSGQACSATTGNFCTVSSADITPNHVVAECTFSKPSAITTDVEWDTETAGQLVLRGTCTDGTCTANIVLVEKDN